MPTRKLNANYANVPSTWYGDSALLTQLLNAFHVLVAEGERYMMASIKPVMERATDPTLRNALVSFIAQEAQHAKEHSRVHRVLATQGLHLSRYEKVCRIVGRRLLPALFSPQMNVAMTSGIEHWTASVGELVLEERWFAHADPRMRDLFEWHSAEEIEHRAVAFDALASYAPGYARRVCGFALGTLVLLSLSLIGAVDFLLQTQQLFRWATLRDLGRGLRSSALLRISARVLRYLSPGFDPSGADTLRLAQATLLRLPAERLIAARAAQAE